MLYSNLKSLDLHGESKDIAKILINDFIDECYNSGIEKAVIVHGIGSGVIRKTTQDVLKNNKKVLKYYIDFFNVGTTIVEIKEKN